MSGKQNLPYCLRKIIQKKLRSSLRNIIITEQQNEQITIRHYDLQSQAINTIFMILQKRLYLKVMYGFYQLIQYKKQFISKKQNQNSINLNEQQNLKKQKKSVSLFNIKKPFLTKDKRSVQGFDLNISVKKVQKNEIKGNEQKLRKLKKRNQILQKLQKIQNSISYMLQKQNIPQQL